MTSLATALVRNVSMEFIFSIEYDPAAESHNTHPNWHSFQRDNIYESDLLPVNRVLDLHQKKHTHIRQVKRPIDQYDAYGSLYRTTNEEVNIHSHMFNISQRAIHRKSAAFASWRI